MAISILRAIRRSSPVFSTVLLPTIVAAQAHAEPVRLTNGSSARWELVKQDGDQYCLLRSRLQGAAKLDTLDVSRSIGGRELALTLHGPKTGKPWSQLASRYEIGADAEKSRQVMDYDKDNGRRAVSIEFHDDEATALYQGSPLSLSIEQEYNIAIDTSGLAALVPSVDACDRNRLVALGADPQLLAKVAVEPYADDSALFSSDDYPVDALRNNQQGTTTALLLVSKNGAVKECRVVKSSSFEALDNATCDTLRRRKFEAARGVSGKPVASPMSVKVRWALPDEPPLPVEFASFRYIFPIDEHRRVTGCKVESSRPTTTADGSCEFMLNQAKQMVSTAPKSVPLAGQEMVMATEFLVGQSDAPIRLGQGKGETLIGRGALHLSIDATGKATSCSAEDIGSFQSGGERPLCDEALKQRYAALPEDVTNQSERQMTIVRALYLRRH